MAESEENRWSEFQLGVESGDIVIESSDENHLAAVRLVEQAQHRLNVFTRDMEPRIFDNSDFIEAIRSLAVKDNKAHIRFLVIEPDRAVKLGHRLLELSRRLSSTMEMRKVHEDYSANPESYLIVDDRGLLHRKLASRYEGIVNFNNPSDVARLEHHFTEVWEHSSPQLDFKRLFI